jgi:hypothetical protein
MNALHGEVIRLFSTRLPLWALLAAVGAGGGLTGLLALIGPEHSTPPLPGIETAEGVGLVVGLGGLLLFVPALIGTIAITSEYRHRTVGTTFLMVPRRGRVLGAKLVVYTAFGAAYGITSSVASALALAGSAALRGVELGVAPVDLVTMLAQLSLAATVYMVLGVAIGALARHQILAIGIVVGYFYFLEHVLMIIPGVNVAYRYLPGGATASLTDFTFLTDTIAEQTPLTAAELLPPLAGAAVLTAYALIAAAAAVIAPLRRDLG